MAGRASEMRPSVMLDNIRNQPLSLRCVADHHLGEGAEDLRAAAAAIRSAGSVVFTGMGSSMSAAIPAANYLESHGFAPEVLDASEWLHFGTGWPRTGASVCVSRSGETVEIVSLWPRLSACAGPNIGVSTVRADQLGRATEHPTHINSEPDRMVAVQTYTGTMATLLLLAAAVLEESDDKWRTSLDGAIDALSAAIDEAISQSEDWNKFLANAEVVH